MKPYPATEITRTQKEEIQQEIWDYELQLKIIKKEKEAVLYRRQQCEFMYKAFRSGNFDTYYDVCTGHTDLQDPPSADFDWYKEIKNKEESLKELLAQAKLKMKQIKERR